MQVTIHCLPIQLGYDSRGGCEAAAHHVSKYQKDATHRSVRLMIYMKNAINCLRRDRFSKVTLCRAPGIIRIFWQAFSNTSILFYNDKQLNSSTCIQQGESFGTVLFSLGIDKITRMVTWEFNAWY